MTSSAELPSSGTALMVTAAGDSSVLAVQDRPVGAPAAGELLVKVAAAGINFIDVYQRQGVYPMQTPFASGNEGAGVVAAIGPDGPVARGDAASDDPASDFAVGDRVAWAQVLGSAAEYVIVPAASAVPVPAEVELDIAAAAMLQGMTAHYLVYSTYSVQPGDTVLVHAAAGGVGQLLVQLCKAKGARVIGTTSTADKAAKARALGADEIIDYTRVDDLAAAVRAANDGAGVAVVYDGVGKDTFDASLASLRIRGTLALFGGASGQVPPVDPQRLNSGGSLFLTRPTLVHYVASRAELLERGTSILASIADGSLQIEIGGRYPLADAARAYDDLESRRSTGKLLLIP